VSTKVRAFIDFLRSQWDCGEHAPSS
ncbi:LysR family transcriptional regulator, partial [Salmonella enterica subsp. enterica serovar Typhimurium]|nr:LysR family transcriptional regulator [Salmonella enterica subsp. enterica serovar Typhimurium]EME1251691.1 LysR family transcriptional regulator [Salmonella enterica]EME1307157.1 LysR family transcriptional regulator [Salmonella enterica]